MRLRTFVRCGVVVLLAALSFDRALAQGSEAQPGPPPSAAKFTPKKAPPGRKASSASKPVPAAAAAPALTPLKRDILALYDGAHEAAPSATRIHRLLEMPLNHLGYRVVYWDIAKGVPPVELSERAFGFATWFHNSATNAEAYFGWAQNAVRAGLKAIVIESPGLLGASAELPAINGFLTSLGVEYADYYVGDTAKTTIAATDAGMIGFEQALLPEMLAHHVVRAKTRDVRRHLALIDPAHVWAKADAAILVATSSRGGFIAPGFATRFDPADKRLRWIVNPFAFLTAALGPQRFPIPDTTTQSGRRIYFSHIDGDSWNGPAVLPGDPLAGRPSAEVILRDLIEPYPDLPVSVGLISSDIDPEHGGDVRAVETARRYFKLPQVEVASHTHTHPFEWSFFSAYDRTHELQRLLTIAATRPASVNSDRSLAAVVRAARNQQLAPITVATDSVYELPRAKVHRPFSLETEVKGALETSTRLAPAGKAARLYLWSGNTSPGEEVIRATRDAGVRNMNGGDARLDTEYPSVSYVPAIGKIVGGERQIYAAASNEHTYTNNWQGPYDGFARLAETVANTDSPRRLKPFNIYYHMYSASRPESLGAVKQNLELARASRITPIAASDYAAIADSFYDVSFVEAGPQTWQILNRGSLQTVRFDDAAAELAPDYAASQGVIGHTRHAGALYVALEPGVEVVALKMTTAPRRANTRAWLTDSRWTVSGVIAEPCRLRGQAQGFGAGEMTWSGVKPGGRWRFSLGARGGSVDATAAADGTLTVILPGTAFEPVTFDGRCL
jgi:polysaccharide biosynthesis protein PelA